MNIVDIYRLMRNAHIQAQSVVDTVPQPLLVLDRNFCIEAASRSFYDTFHVSPDETLGKRLQDLGDGQWNIPDLHQLLEGVVAKSTAVIDYEVSHDFPTIGRRTMLISAHRLFQPEKSGQSMLLSIADATVSREREAQGHLLVGELRHRIKNLLAMVHAMARQTITKGRSAEEYRDAFLGRFHALVRAHELAFETKSEIGLHSLAEQTLAPYMAEEGRVVIEPGPAVTLAPVQLVPINLILHELATNAVKHGALSSALGQVQLSWQVSKDSTPHLRLCWQERARQPVKSPATVGFGTRLISFVVKSGLGGCVDTKYLPSGLLVEIVIPMPSVEIMAVANS